MVRDQNQPKAIIVIELNFAIDRVTVTVSGCEMLPETKISPKSSLFLKLNSAVDRATVTVSGCEQNLRSKSSKSPLPHSPPPTLRPPPSAPSQSMQSGAQLTIRYANSFPKYCNSLSQRITGLCRCSRRANRAECLRETVPLAYFCQRSGHAPFAELSPHVHPVHPVPIRG